MSGLYIIPLSGLKEGGHAYNFEVGEEFFGMFEGSEVSNGELTARVDLEKRSTHLDLRFYISGNVTINCDRCLEPFSHPVSCENRLLVKLGRKWEDDDPDLLTIPSDEHELDVSQFIYEYIHLALPIKRTHPVDKQGKSGCNPAMLSKLREHTPESDKETDPRWDELKKLMNNN